MIQNFYMNKLIKNYVINIKYKIPLIQHLFEYLNTSLRLCQHPSSNTATPLTEKVRREHYLFTCCTRSKQITCFQKKLRSLISWSSAFDTCKNDSNRTTFHVYYQVWNESFLKLFQKLRFWCSSTSERLFH